MAEAVATEAMAKLSLDAKDDKPVRYTLTKLGDKLSKDSVDDNVHQFLLSISKNGSTRNQIADTLAITQDYLPTHPGWKEVVDLHLKIRNNLDKHLSDAIRDGWITKHS